MSFLQRILRKGKDISKVTYKIYNINSQNRIVKRNQTLSIKQKAEKRREKVEELIKKIYIES